MKRRTMDWIYGKTLSRGRASDRFDITTELAQKVKEMNLYENFSVKRGTINICLEQDLIFEWEAVIHKFLWKSSNIYCGAKLHKCSLGCKNEEGEWEDSVAYLYDPDNENDDYRDNSRKWEVLAETEFSWLRCRGDKQFDVRIKLSSNEF